MSAWILEVAVTAVGQLRILDEQLEEEEEAKEILDLLEENKGWETALFNVLLDFPVVGSLL